MPTRRLAGWLEDLGGDITAVTVDETDAYALTETLDEQRAAEPSEMLTLVPGFDPWVLGPGTADARIVPPQRRQLFSNGAAPVLRGGYVSGTWRRHGPIVAVEWFEELGPIPSAELEDAVRRLGQAAGTDLSLR